MRKSLLSRERKTPIVDRKRKEDCDEGSPHTDSLPLYFPDHHREGELSPQAVKLVIVWRQKRREEGR